MQPSGLHRLAQISERVDVQLGIKKLDALGPQTRQRRHGAKIARQLLLELVEQREVSGLADIGDLAGEILADAGQFRQIRLRRQHTAHALRQVSHGTGGAAVGAHAELVLALDLQEISGLVEHIGDLGVLDRHRSRSLLIEILS